MPEKLKKALVRTYRIFEVLFEVLKFLAHQSPCIFVNYQTILIIFMSIMIYVI
jgi:hypothetical protein